MTRTPGLQRIRETIETSKGTAAIFNIRKLGPAITAMPYSLRVILEALARNVDGATITEADVEALSGWSPGAGLSMEIPFMPARVILQDFTGVPAVVDLAALRSAIQRAGGDPGRINPEIPVDLVIDHSIQVDCHGSSDAMDCNIEKEFQRNQERYRFLKWAQGSFCNFKVVPPGKGIIHQVNLEYLAGVVHVQDNPEGLVACPDTVLGTDSHTPMINSLGVLGWGVGGIEAEATMLGQPYYMNVPEVIGVKLVGTPPPRITATDIVLTLVQRLREHGVVGKIVEFFGPGLEHLDVTDRAVISNMTPEHGATAGFFPVDEKTIQYLLASGRDENHVRDIEAYLKRVGLFRDEGAPGPGYDAVVEMDLSTIERSLAGHKRPQDRVPLRGLKEHFSALLPAFGKEPGQALGTGRGGLEDGSVVIAAITSCTNTSNPALVIGAGLLARNALERGLKVKEHVKTSLAPGSRVVTRYLEDAGLIGPLESLGFHVVGYGCMTCIGNSGPLDANIVREIHENDLVVASVTSGNRNFEGRISPHTKANYLASPLLVVAFAIAGTVNLDMEREPIGNGADGTPVMLEDVWPTTAEIRALVQEHVRPSLYTEEYSTIFEGGEDWAGLNAPESKTYEWDDGSTYVREPPFFLDFPAEAPGLRDIEGARVLALLGDSVTTDHISPAGVIPADGPAARYLVQQGVGAGEFNSFGSRRGNHEVMMRGTFANIRLKNQLVEREGGWTLLMRGDGRSEEVTIFDASEAYRKEGTPLIVIAGKEYGTGSSRDWAAKGPALLGVRAVLAESYERIHRSNLIGMGVLPLQFLEGEGAGTHEITGREVFTIEGLNTLSPGMLVDVRLCREDGNTTTFKALARIDSPIEARYLQNGGILHAVLRAISLGKKRC